MPIHLGLAQHYQESCGIVDSALASERTWVRFETVVKPWIGLLAPNASVYRSGSRNPVNSQMAHRFPE